MQADLIATARQLGVAMGSRWRDVQIGWTTDKAKADACAEAGLVVRAGYNRVGPCGWEVAALPDEPPEAEPPESSSAGGQGA